MCGIAGFVNIGLNPEDAGALLASMTDLIRHRGPDDGGHWLRDGVGLGVRRLSIIDRSGGKQPIANEDGSVIVVYNGEIYNYRALRQELEALGHRFTTNSDTETIVHAYEEDGLEFTRRLRGMFAIALWDQKRGRLVLARDRFGKKPLYYCFDGNRVLFGSEMKSLLLAPGLARELDPGAIEQYFTYGYIPAPRTALAGISKLPAAHALSFENGSLALRRYWQLDFTPRSQDDEETAVRRVRELLTEAVRIRLMSEVPLGAFLSGGIDSSCVVALMSQATAEPVKTFSIGFEERGYSEVEYARLVAQRYQTDHHEFIVRLDLLDVLPRLIWDFDEPFADASMVPTYYVSKLARQHVTVALAGDGGDELFGGYTRYARAMTEQLGDTLGPLRRLAPVASRLMWDGMRGKNRLRTLALDPAMRYTETSSLVATPLRQQLIRREFLAQGAGDSRSVLLDLFAEVKHLDFYTAMQRVDVESYLPYDILTKVDKASMLTSLETRAPLLDHVLAEYVASLPHQRRTYRGRQKYLLKRAVQDVLPEEILNRPKQGFRLPIDHWFRGELKDLTWDLLESQQARNRGVVHLDTVKRWLLEHQNLARNHDLRIWAWLCFELWCRIYLDRADQAALWPLKSRPAPGAPGGGEG